MKIRESVIFYFIWAEFILEFRSLIGAYKGGSVVEQKLLLNQAFKGILNETASASATPGGGSISALAGALGSSLVAMIACLSVAKDQCPDQEAIRRILKDSKMLMNQLALEADEDIKAFSKVMSAYGLPRATEEDKVSRASTIQLALKDAAEAPLRVAELCLEVIKLSDEALEKGNKNAASDAVAGGLLAEAALQAVLLNVAVNLKLIKDDAWKVPIKDQMLALSLQGEEARKKLIEALRS